MRMNMVYVLTTVGLVIRGYKVELWRVMKGNLERLTSRLNTGNMQRKCGGHKAAILTVTSVNLKGCG